MTAGLLDRVAGAPISWGVSEVPGWGHQLDRDRVLSEMASIGLHATELGPDGFLPAGPAGLASALAAYGLRAVGAFVPVFLHEPSRLDHELKRVAAASDALAACGAQVCVLAAATRSDGYDVSTDLDEAGWAALLAGLDRASAVVAERGLVLALHPHMGTVVERLEHVQRVLAGSTTKLCLDTGHLMVGGSDPLALARAVPDRVAHVHLKDIDAGVADRVRRGDTGYRDAVAGGLYRPLGDGDLDVAGIVRSLEAAGFEGWYVLEQDVVLSAPPEPEEGPVRAAARSLGFLAAIADSSHDALTLVGEGKRGTPHRAATRD